ncbi:unnamed protein product [Didymodactylos carnosus]|uniref:30S ribosomal protein S9, chloroplastic n=1 Tax=Didymodactylos carnosus TaxID=1234261 RepID=A0A8S2GY53_9BILA|nr:unnamed protein product [Didymodactylos carnosus]CAF3576357.1 unnamed protein product [Didymodactylos carnosus]
MQKTTFLTTQQAQEKRQWFTIDAAGVPLGRLATKVADVLRGKQKRDFTPNQDCGSFVIVINASKVVLTGRRKSSIAKAKLTPGSGKITVNGTALASYFPTPIVIQYLQFPLVITSNDKNFDVAVKVSGGGFTGQSGAIRLAITRALIKADAEYKKVLKAEGLTTRDARSKERKKYGKYGARRSPQFTKR